jgi:hypothetical protein
VFRGGNPQVISQSLNLDVMLRAEIGLKLFKVARQNLSEYSSEKIPYDSESDARGADGFGYLCPIQVPAP